MLTSLEIRPKMKEELQEHINKDTKEDIKKLYDHARVANEEMSGIKIELSQIKTDVGWLKKWFWLVAGTSTGALIAALMNLVIKR